MVMVGVLADIKGREMESDHRNETADL